MNPEIADLIKKNSEAAVKVAIEMHALGAVQDELCRELEKIRLLISDLSVLNGIKNKNMMAFSKNLPWTILR